METPCNGTCSISYNGRTVDRYIGKACRMACTQDTGAIALNIGISEFYVIAGPEIQVRVNIINETCGPGRNITEAIDCVPPTIKLAHDVEMSELAHDAGASSRIIPT